MKYVYLLFCFVLFCSRTLLSEVPANEIPKYGSPDYEPIWARTSPDERPINIANSKDAASKGWNYLRDGDTSMAIKRFNQAWTLYPQNHTALWGMAIVVLERSRSEKGDSLQRELSQAIDLIDEAREISSADASLLTDAALLYATRGGLRRANHDKRDISDFKTSEDLLRAAEKIERHPQIYRTWATLKRYMDDEDAAQGFDRKAASFTNSEG